MIGVGVGTVLQTLVFRIMTSVAFLNDSIIN